jgi:hypothetical protein
MGADLRQPPCPTALVMGDDNVDISGAKFSQTLLLCRVGRCGDERPTLNGSLSMGPIIILAPA